MSNLSRDFEHAHFCTVRALNAQGRFLLSVLHVLFSGAARLCEIGREQLVNPKRAHPQQDVKEILGRQHRSELAVVTGRRK